MLSPMYVGIDVDHKTADVGVIDTIGELIEKVKVFPNNLPGAEKVENHIKEIAEKQQADPLLIATEATGFFDWHLLEFLSQSSVLARSSVSPAKRQASVSAANIFAEDLQV